MLRESGNCMDGICRAVAWEKQSRRHPSPVRDSSSTLLMGPQISSAALSYLGKMHLWWHAQGYGEKSWFASADCRGRRGRRHLSLDNNVPYYGLQHILPCHTPRCSAILHCRELLSFRTQILTHSKCTCYWHLLLWVCDARKSYWS